MSPDPRPRIPAPTAHVHTDRTPGRTPGRASGGTARRTCVAAAAAAVGLLLLAGCSSPDSGAGEASAAIGAPVTADVAPDALAAMDGKAAVGDRSIVRTATVTVRVPVLADAARDWRAEVTRLGGLVTDEYAGDDGAAAFATITAKVPVTQLDAALAAASGLGEALSTNVSTSDVTLAVTDLDARISVLQASITRMQALLDEATSVADIVAVETELTTRQAELDGLLAQQRALADQVAMASITVSLVPEVAGPRSDAPGFIAGLQTGWNALRSLASSATTLLGAAIPFLVLIGLVGGAVTLVMRRRRPRPVPDRPAADGHAPHGHAGADQRADANADGDRASG